MHFVAYQASLLHKMSFRCVFSEDSCNGPMEVLDIVLDLFAAIETAFRAELITIYRALSWLRM